MNQTILKDVGELEKALEKMECRRIFLVCDSAYPFLCIREQIAEISIPMVMFSDFCPNPQYESVVEGVKVFNENRCDAILAVGGGSAIDMAKCIKLYATMEPQQNYLQQPIVPNSIPLIAIPTTAGTGSEATRYAVIYYNGEKQSVTHDSIIPGMVILDPKVLKTLPEYQRKATVLDALCHGIESWWSINSTEESRGYSEQAVGDILKYMGAYLANEEEGNAKMLRAAHIAGKAINISQTTAGHAMCYKLTSLYGVAHGHAAALCISSLWPYMQEHLDDCIDPRGKEHLQTVFENLAGTFGCSEVNEAPKRFQELLDSLALDIPNAQESDFEVLAASVNLMRLKNNPLQLSKAAIEKLYHQILN